MLEGRDGDNGYFVTLKVLSKNKERARELSLQKAKEIGFHIVSVEEVEKVSEILSDGKEIVELSSGRSYFKTEK